MDNNSKNMIMLPGTAAMLPYLTHGKSRAISAENRTVEKGKGGMAASVLGKSRKGSPGLNDAPQSFPAPDGRRIMVAWANEWEWMPFFKDWGPTYREGWCGFFNFPREVNMTKSGRLSFVPIRELKKYRKKTGKYVQDKLVICDSQHELKSDDGIAFELKFNINLRASNAQKLLVKLRCDEVKETVCIFDLKNGELEVNRNKADGWSKGISHSILFLKEKDRNIGGIAIWKRALMLLHWENY